MDNVYTSPDSEETLHMIICVSPLPEVNVILPLNRNVSSSHDNSIASSHHNYVYSSHDDNVSPSHYNQLPNSQCAPLSSCDTCRRLPVSAAAAWSWESFEVAWIVLLRLTWLMGAGAGWWAARAIKAKRSEGDMKWPHPVSWRYTAKSFL